jgi:Zn-dependent protease
MELATIIFLILILLFSVIIHEVSHGLMADYLGDPTPRTAGRLTLNPINHLDPIGSFAVPLMLVFINAGFVIGWAKPVPVNPFNFRDKTYGQAKVAAAGPLSNLLVAAFFGLLIRLLPLLSNAVLARSFLFFFSYIVWINVLLAVFNLMPIPPLDGSHILFAFLPRTLDNLKRFFIQYQLFILVFFIFFLIPLIVPIVRAIFTLMTGMTGLPVF